MGRIVLFYSSILFVVITSTLCTIRRGPVRVNSTHQELSCGHQQAILITYVYRNQQAYCGKFTSTCSWTKTTDKSCPIDSLPQLIYTCNGKNKCSGTYSILHDNMCCNGATGEPTCQNSTSFDNYFDCVKDMKILDLDTDKERFISGKRLIIRAPMDPDNLCECSVRPKKSNSFFFYYCDTSIHSRNCTSRQFSSNQQNFSLNQNKFSSLLLEKTSKEQRITSTPNPPTTSNVETPTTEKEKEKTGITEKEKEKEKTGITEKEKEKTGITEKEKEKGKTDGSNTMVMIASAVGGGLLLIVTTVLVVCLCKKRQGSVKDSTATDSAVNNIQYFNNRNNDALDDDGYYNVLPQNINSNVPQEIADTYHHIGYSQNRPVVNDVDDTYNHIGGLREDTSNRQAARNDHNDVDDTYNHIGGLSTSNRQAARNDHHMGEQTQGGNSSNDEVTYTAVVKNVSGKVTGQRRVINEDEDDKTYAEVNKNK